jgi:hypothetical protein
VAKLAVTDIHLERGGVACARPTKQARLDRIDAVDHDTASRALALDALAKGAPFDGNLVAGSTYLRIQVELDHLCGGHDTLPSVGLRLDDGEVLVHAVDESMPT